MALQDGGSSPAITSTSASTVGPEELIAVLAAAVRLALAAEPQALPRSLRIDIARWMVDH